MSLHAKLSTFEGTLSHLPRDSVDSMVSTLAVRIPRKREKDRNVLGPFNTFFYVLFQAILMELRAYDEEIIQLEARLREIPADIESQRLSTALTGIRTRVAVLLGQAEQGRIVVEQAREDREKRGQEIRNYKSFLDETDGWLRDVTSTMHERHSFDTNKVCWLALIG